MTPVFRKLLLGLALAWAAYAALRELNGALSGYDTRDRLATGPVSWRAGMPQVDRLAQFLDAARPFVPAGSAVVFTSPASPEALFRYRWAAYLYPEVELIPLADPQAGTRGRYLLAYRTKIDHPRLEPLRWLPGGWLYRIRAKGP